MTRIKNNHRAVGRDREAVPTRLDKLYEILSRADAMPRLDVRSEDEILGYGESGIPTDSD